MTSGTHTTLRDPVYTRIRASLCPIHGLGGISGKSGEYRDTKSLLDEYAAQVTAVVLKAKSGSVKKVA
jgi:hypothetical protein